MTPTTAADCQVVTSSPFADAAVIATALGALAFVIAYAIRSHGAWRGNGVGQNIMAFMVVVLIVSSLAVVSIFFGRDWPARELVRGTAWGAVAFVVWWRVVLVWTLHPRKKRPPKSGDPAN